MDPQSQTEQPVSPPVTTPPPANTPVDPAPKKYGLMGLWVIIALLVGIGVGMVLDNKTLLSGLNFSGTAPKPTATPTGKPDPTPTPDPTRGWTTYTDFDMGFSVKHPDGFTLNSGKIPGNGTQVSLTSEGETILIIKKPDLNPNTGKPYTSLAQFEPRVKEFTPIQIGMIPAYDSGVYETQGGTKQRDIVFNINGAVWAFQDILMQDSQKNLFSLIISTFKLTDQNLNQDSSAWKTYTNTAAEFSFKYPPDYKLNENKVTGVDGVVMEKPDTIQLLSPTLPNTKGNFSLIINYEKTDLPLKDYIDQKSQCSSVKSKDGVASTLGGADALLFESTPCGINGATILFTVKNGMAYTFTIESHITENEIKPYYNTILSTFKFL